MNLNKRRIVTIDGPMLGFLLRGRRDVTITSDWPEDAEIASARWDDSRRKLLLMVLSESFDEVPIGNQVEDWTPTITAHAVQPNALTLMNMLDRMAAEELAERTALHEMGKKP